MAKALEGTMIRFLGSTGLPVKPYDFLGRHGGFIRPNEYDEANLAFVVSQIGYGLVVARVCLLEAQKAERLICLGEVEYDAFPFTSKFVAMDVAGIFNSIKK